jgi:O-antigen/teichoic acid export membrane protein
VIDRNSPVELSPDASGVSTAPMTSASRMALNASAMMGAQLITWTMAFVLAIFQPRILGPLAIGQLSIAFSIWTIASVLINFGMDLHLTKVVARDPSQTSPLVSTSLVLRFGFWLVIMGAMLIYDFFFDTFSPTQSALIWIIGFSTLLASLFGAMGAALTGLEQIAYLSLINVVNKVILTVLSIVLLFAGFNVLWIGGVYVVSQSIALMGVAYFLFRQHPFVLRFKLTIAREMLFASRKYLVTALTLIVYQQIDNLFIASFASTEAVGWYNTASNLFGTLMFFPVAIGTVIFPSLVRSHAAGEHHLSSTARRIFNLMLAMSVPIGLGLMVLAEPIVLLIYGEAFAPTGQVLAVLGVVLIFTYLNTVLGPMLMASERTISLNVVMIIAALATLPLDFVLVTWTDSAFNNGALGGALAFFVTELGILIGFIYLLPKGTLGWVNLRASALTLCAGGLMVASIWWLRSSAFFLLGVPLGAMVYCGALLLLRVLPAEDLSLVKEALHKLRVRLFGSRDTVAKQDA